MTFSEDIEHVIDKALGKMCFAPDADTVLTPKDRAQQAEKALRSLVKSLLKGLGAEWSCPACGFVEHLSPAHEIPMHRHDKALYLLRRVTA